MNIHTLTVGQPASAEIRDRESTKLAVRVSHQNGPAAESFSDVRALVETDEDLIALRRRGADRANDVSEMHTHAAALERLAVERIARKARVNPNDPCGLAREALVFRQPACSVRRLKRLAELHPCDAVACWPGKNFDFRHLMLNPVDGSAFQQSAVMNALVLGCQERAVVQTDGRPAAELGDERHNPRGGGLSLRGVQPRGRLR